MSMATQSATRTLGKIGLPAPLKDLASRRWDVIIVGGGPAGLSAALILGRSCRRVLVFDTGKQRNRFSDSLNGYLTRDKIPPKEFLRLAKEDLKPYPV